MGPASCTVIGDSSAPPPPPTPMNERKFTVLHFNDCYNVESCDIEPFGGAARFVTALNQFEDHKPLVLFSGDIIGPSIMSTFTKGDQMLPVLESCKVDCALFGNHEFDYGLDNLLAFVGRTKFPWLMSNVFMKDTGLPLGGGLVKHIIEHQGVRVGLIGLIEEDWLATLVLDRATLHYESFIEVGRNLARELRTKDNVDIVIALTHMRTHNDVLLAENVDEIDLFLGGHDHVYDVKEINGHYIVKSGTDFRQFSKIDIVIRDDQEQQRRSSTASSTAESNISICIEEHDVTSKFKEDEHLAKILEKYHDKIEGQMDVIVANIGCDLDGRFSAIRTSETNLGNLIADIILDAAHDADFALINSGTLRSDRIHRTGPLKMRDIVTILPYMESILILNITGKQTVRALENSVSKYPLLEGRFAQLSGISFEFDPRKPPGSRVDVSSIRIRNQPIDLSRTYRMVAKEFISGGKDGYDVLKECSVFKNTEECMAMTSAITQYFDAGRVLASKGMLDDYITDGVPILSHLEHPKQSQSILATYAKLDKTGIDITKLPLVTFSPRKEQRIIVRDS